MAVAAAVLGACAPLPPAVPEHRRVELPAQWSESSAAQGGADTAAALSTPWWRQLGDPQLDDRVHLALAHNNDVLAAAVRVQEAQANAAAAAALGSPQLHGTLAGQTGRTLGAFGSAHTRSLQPGLQASWEPDLWGRLAAQGQAADQRLLASAADQDAVALTVAAATVQTYVGLRSLQAQLHIAQATAALRERALALAQDQQRVGYISLLQLTQAEAELHSVRQQVVQLELAVRKQGVALNLLCGEAGTPLPTGGDAAALESLALPPVPSSLPSQLLERRADIARAQHLLAAADHSLQAQRAALLPQVTLTTSAGSLLINSLQYHPLTVWSVGGSLLAPLFDGGRREAALQVSTAQRDQAALAYRGAVLNAFADVENALAATTRLAQQMEHAVRRRAVLQRSVGFAHDRTEAGYASYLEELDAQRNLFQAELEVAKLRQAELENRVQLYKALGGGWQGTRTPAPQAAAPLS